MWFAGGLKQVSQVKLFCYLAACEDAQEQDVVCSVLCIQRKNNKCVILSIRTTIR